MQRSAECGTLALRRCRSTACTRAKGTHCLPVAPRCTGLERLDTVVTNTRCHEVMWSAREGRAEAAKALCLTFGTWCAFVLARGTKTDGSYEKRFESNWLHSSSGHWGRPPGRCTDKNGGEKDSTVLGDPATPEMGQSQFNDFPVALHTSSSTRAPGRGESK
jgi:hypothetical protein